MFLADNNGCVSAADADADAKAKALPVETSEFDFPHALKQITSTTAQRKKCCLNIFATSFPPLLQ